jgi:ankyrin repeat protein
VDVLNNLIFSADVNWDDLINCQDRRGRTAFHWACINSQHALVERLLTVARDTIDVGVFDHWQGSPLHYAVKNSDPVIVQTICDFFTERQSYRLNGQYTIETDATDTGENPLHTATRQQWVDGVKFLLERAPKLACAVDVAGIPPVFNTAIYGSVECFELFLRADVERSIACRGDLTGWTFLHFAAHSGSATVLRAALGVNLEVHWWDGPDVVAEEPKATPLALACKAGQLECVLVLLECGANPLANGGPEKTPDGSWKCRGEIADLLTAAARRFA